MEPLKFIIDAKHQTKTKFTISCYVSRGSAGWFGGAGSGAAEIEVTAEEFAALEVGGSVLIDLFRAQAP